MSNPTDKSPLSDALEKNEEAAEEVRKAAEDLAVAHAVLDTKTSQGSAADGEMAHAVAETKKVEKRLDQSAEKLDHVNEALRREAKTRR